MRTPIRAATKGSISLYPASIMMRLSLIIILAGYNEIDPLVAALIGVLIIRSAYGLVRDSTNILLEATPKQFRLEKVAEAIRSVDGVKGVHDLHVWTITSGL